MDDQIDQIRGARYFTSLDLPSGYHQLRMKEEDIPKTAFICCFGHYEYTVMHLALPMHLHSSHL